MIEIGEQYSTKCEEKECFGSVTGVFGGKFLVGAQEIKYSQILNGKCDCCGAEKAEFFEVWDHHKEEFYTTSLITIPLTEDSEICFPGLGRAAYRMSPECRDFLRTGIKTD